MESTGFQAMGDSSERWHDTAAADQVNAERARQLVVNFQKSTFCQLLICQLSKVNFWSTFDLSTFDLSTFCQLSKVNFCQLSKVNFQKSTFCLLSKINFFTLNPQPQLITLNPRNRVPTRRLPMTRSARRRRLPRVMTSRARRARRARRESFIIQRKRSVSSH